MDSKKWYKSKTMYLGGSIASLGLAILTMPELQRLILDLPADQKGIALVIIGGLVGALRIITKQPVEW